MKSLKRCTTQLNPIIIDSDSEDFYLKKSLKKIKTTSQDYSKPSPYDSIPEVPNIKLTIQQMQSDPVELIRKLQKQYSQYGGVKLTVCQAWNSPFLFGNIDKLITVRKQVLQDLTKGKVILVLSFLQEKAFEQNVKCYTLANYKSKAKNFSKNYKIKTNPLGNSQSSRMEHEYWNLVTNPKYINQVVEVEYAADLPSSQYGSGFPTKKINNWLDSDFQYHSNLFNLNNLYRSPTSLLQIVDEKKDKISGITSPWMYVGMQFATFCWHVEDLYLNSLNYSHEGATKTWYIIPGKDKQKFDKYVKHYYENNKRKNLLEKITLIVDPLQLIKEGIRVYKINQNPRDYVLTFIKAYHCGFSHGYNVGEAVNLAGFSSLSGIKDSFNFYKEQQKQFGKFHPLVLPIQWVIYQIINQGKLMNYIQQKNEKQQKQIIFNQILKQYNRMLNIQYSMINQQLLVVGQFYNVQILSDKKRYYSNMCSLCKNYVYLSSLECTICHKNLCSRHLQQCKCQNKKWILKIRKTNFDRQKILKLVPLIKQKQKQISLE